MNIDRCYCYKRSFGELKDIARRNDVETIPDLQEYATFGHNCELCHPYVRRMLRTGQIRFKEIITPDDEPVPPAENS